MLESTWPVPMTTLCHGSGRRGGRRPNGAEAVLLHTHPEPGADPFTRVSVFIALTAISGLVVPASAADLAVLNPNKPVSFIRQVVPALSVAGCIAGACHGTPSGKNGFKLSLRGFDPTQDYKQLVLDGRVERLRFRRYPEGYLKARKTSSSSHVCWPSFFASGEVIIIRPVRRRARLWRSGPCGRRWLGRHRERPRLRPRSDGRSTSVRAVWRDRAWSPPDG